MTPYKLVGLSGYIGAGKDHMVRTYFRPAGYTQLSFAWLLKWVAIAQGKCTWEEAFVTKPPHVRTLLQVMGTEEWRATYGVDCWVRGLDAVARTFADVNETSYFVVADVRFPNEVEAVRQLGGPVFRVHAPERTARAAEQLTPEQRAHDSEVLLGAWSLDAFDGVIPNDPGEAPHAALDALFTLYDL